MTGEKIIKVERQHIKRNEALKELDQIAETIQTPQKTSVFSSTFLENLPAKVGIFIGQGEAKLVQTDVLRYPSDTEYPTLIQAEPYQSDINPKDNSKNIMEAL